MSKTRVRKLPATMRRRATRRDAPTPAGTGWTPGHYDGPTDTGTQIQLARFMATGIVAPIYRRNPGACLSLIMMAQALDIPLATASNGIYWNPAVGKGSITAQLMAALLHRTGYTFKIVEETDQRVAMVFYHTVDGRRRRLGQVEWTILEAIGACLTWREQWRYYPRDMLWARCLMRGARRYASSVGTGLAYTRDEIDDMSAAETGGEVDTAVKDILDTATNPDTPSDIIRGELVKLATKRGLLDYDTGEGEPLGKVLGLLWGQARAREADAVQAETGPPGRTETAEVVPAGTGDLPCGCPARPVLTSGQHERGCCRG